MKILLSSIAAVLLLAAAPGASNHHHYVVHIADYSYHPENLRVHVGDSVTFVNEDEQAHTVTAQAAESIDSGPIDWHKSWTTTFHKAGRYDYYCEPHPYMRGSVTVVGP